MRSVCVCVCVLLSISSPFLVTHLLSFNKQCTERPLSLFTLILGITVLHVFDVPHMLHKRIEFSTPRETISFVMRCL